MATTFYKYQGTGNDFVIIDNRSLHFDKNDTNRIKSICDRRFGVGADGLILLENHPDYDFKMVYYNSDGNESTMCGNGGRCLVAFAKFLGIIESETVFEAVDGPHRARINKGIVELQMLDVEEIDNSSDHSFLNTGSPHVVVQHKNLDEMDILNEARKIRYSERFKEKGTNVNFVKKISDDTFAVRTYERGVEDETLSCGTGVTAVGIAMNYLKMFDGNEVYIQTPGGNLMIRFNNHGEKYTNVWLIGPAKQVFKGEL
ncbi:diaminopimelate epimerase [Aegicerativicinus sediminis]|uniref:diaminopimelate epimerase n=1 Tax=Aegicerativicinus sediminis TaxID=2893202 RepID=UPI001E3591E5|nr:diaminopimelate epimerase [Aegicerativicinus sediminis]